jgi:hypothetical protein
LSVVETAINLYYANQSGCPIHGSRSLSGVEVSRNVELSDKMAPGLDARISQIAAEIAADKEMIVHPELFNYTRSQLNHAIEKVWGQPEPDNKNYLFLQKLKDNVTMFAGYKSAWQTTHLRKDVEQSRNADVEQSRNAINARYNVNWMRTEYEHTVRSARAAKNYQKYEQDKDLYPYLRYMPSTAAEPRGEHMRLYGIVKPIDDPFWDTWMPPADWGCRCSVEQVRNPNPESLAKQPPDDITLPPATMRNNPGKSGQIFTDKHPMISKVKPEMRAKIEDAIKALNNEIITKEIKSIDDLTEVIKIFDEKTKNDYFARGFKSMYVYESGPNGKTNLNGSIGLKRRIYNSVIGGLNNIRLGVATTYTQEQALSTLWHEILHNKNKIGNVPMTAMQRKNMELANEFVSRNTLPEFMKMLGGKLHHKDLMDARPNTGYDHWVVNYDQLIVRMGADKAKVLADVQSHLFNKSYNEQKEGLRDALMNNTDQEFKKATVNKSVGHCLTEHPDRYLLSVEQVLNPKKKEKK